MEAVKKLHHFIHTKDYMWGGISAADTFNKVNHYINKILGKSNRAFTHDDGQQRDRMVFKELMKFLAAFEVIEALPREFNDIKSDLELSIAEAVGKGHAVMCREKILPPLSVAKGKYDANTTTVAAISEEAKKMFLTSWGGVWASCRLEIWPKFGDDLVNLSFKSCRNGEFGKAGDGDFAI